MAGEEDHPMLVGFLLGVTLTLGAAAIHHAHHRQWHVRLLRQTRALPEHRPHAREERP